jgi:hypothetical protein
MKGNSRTWDVKKKLGLLYEKELKDLGSKLEFDA